MCRHAAAIGPGIRLTELMWDMPHSLQKQSYLPRELLVGTVCADGFGVAWYDPDTRPEPARYASAMPIWSDANLPSFGPVVRSPLVMGAVRNATVAGANSEANCAPFASGRYCFSLNGFLEDFDGSWREWLRAEWIAPARRSLVRGTTDGENLFQALLSRLDVAEDTGEATLPNTLLSLVRDVLARADETGRGAHLNVLVADGASLLATRAGSGPRQNSLYLLSDGDEFPGTHVVASEPLNDDPSWARVGEDTLLVLRHGAPPVRLKV